MDPLGRASWAVPERVSTSRGHSSPGAGLPEQARRETERRTRASLRRRRSQGDRGSGSSLREAGGAARCRRPRAALPQPRWMDRSRRKSQRVGRIRGDHARYGAPRRTSKQASNHQSCLTVTLLGCCRSAVRVVGRQCRSRSETLLPPGRYDRSPKQALPDDRATR